MRYPLKDELMEVVSGDLAPANRRQAEADACAAGRIGEILVGNGSLRAVDVDRVLNLQRGERIKFGEAARQLGLITPDELSQAIAKQYWPSRTNGTGLDVSSELVVAREPAHPCAEELRALRTQLLLRWSNGEAPSQQLAIVSPGAGEGRSYVAANLAIAFAEIGRRTLLVDADMRAPRQHQFFDIYEPAGLAAILAGKADLGALVPLPDFGTLSLLPAGARTHNPLELLSRPMLGSLLKQIQSDFDVILFDTPPTRRYADAYCLVLRAGQALVLTRKDHTRYADTADTVREIGDTGARVIGTVLNAF